MATSAVPAVIDALLTKSADALQDMQVLVLDGFGKTDDPADYLMIGVDDPDSPDFASAATAEQEWAFANTTTRNQAGDVICAALSWNGDANQKTARDAAYATVAAVEVLLREDPQLGLVPSKFVYLIASFGGREELMQVQDADGALAMVIFQVHFEARI